MDQSRRNALKGIASSATVGLAGCLGSQTVPSTATTTATTTSADSETVRAAFVYHDVVGDFGWQWAHEQGRRTIEAEFEWLATEIFEKSDPTESERRFEQYAQRGFDIIFATSYDYMDPVYSVAPDFPDVKFEHCSGYKERENMGRYFGRMYQPRFLSGIAAGLLTEQDDIGYVAAYPIPEVIRGINAFALGIAEVAQDATVRVHYTNTWSDATIESDAAETLMGDGSDVIAQHQNYPAAAQRASEAGIWAIGYNSPMGDIVGENYVTSPIWDWSVFYRDAVTQVYNERWEPDFFWKGLESGIVGLSDWGPNVPTSVIDQVKEERERILNGDQAIWAGTAYESATDAELYTEMNDYVDNVVVDSEG